MQAEQTAVTQTGEPNAALAQVQDPDKNKTVLEITGREAKRAVKVYHEEVQSLYNALAQCTDNIPEPLSDTVRNEVASLTRASESFRQAQRDTSAIADELSSRLGDTRKSMRYKRLKILNPPSNGSIDLREAETRHFAMGMNVYKLMLILIAGSVIGVIVEDLFFLVYVGYYIRRSGVIYGPFNFVYGLGAVAMSLVLYRYRNRGRLFSFLWGMGAGSLVEYFCSWVEEFMTGARSWDYTNQPFNLNGRISLLSAIAWGLLGVFWIKDAYPYVAQAILMIPNSIGKRLVTIVTILLILDGLLSGAAVVRWSQRVNGSEASTAMAQFLDDHYPDERMRELFPSMVFGTDAQTDGAETAAGGQ